MSTSEYKKAFEAANGDKEAYLKATAEFGERHRGTALLMWSQFQREREVRQCVCKTGGELVNFLKRLPIAHMEFSISTTYSEDIESGYISVDSNPLTKMITIIGSADDV